MQRKNTETPQNHLNSPKRMKQHYAGLDASNLEKPPESFGGSLSFP